MQIHAWAGEELAYSKTYYSIGGGFIVDEENFGKTEENPIQALMPSTLRNHLSLSAKRVAYLSVD